MGSLLAVHATVRGPHYFAADLYDQFIDVHTLSHPFAQMIQMTSLILRGVMERFPRLRLAFMEAGCSWVPYWMGRMDEEWTAQLLGPQVLFYASDWPHWDHEFPENIHHLKKREDLSSEAKRWILAETAKAMYRLN